MRLKPIITERSLENAKLGKYTFLVGSKDKKPEIKSEINNTFGVGVKTIRTIKIHGGIKKNLRGEKVRIKSFKKVIVTLGVKEKIDLFEENKKSKSK